MTTTTLLSASSKSGRRPARAPLLNSALDFELLDGLHATEPPETRGLARDQVRLMVSRRSSDAIDHTRFHEIGRFLREGDVLVINTSGTRNAALAATGPGGKSFELHLSTQLRSGLWLVELRLPSDRGTVPFLGAVAGEVLSLPAAGSVRLISAHRREASARPGGGTRLWNAALDLPRTLDEYLDLYGSPIRYGYVPEPWPLKYYQTVYATERGSAEMPSAGRAFTPALLTALAASGITVAPLLLNTGVSSPEVEEPPYEEYYRVPAATARIVNSARSAGARVIAVGTTVVRALETVADECGIVHACHGWTDLVVSPERGVRVVDALLTGLHEPRASHLKMLEAIGGRRQLRRAYAEALSERYLWHEFGDLHLMLP